MRLVASIVAIGALVALAGAGSTDARDAITLCFGKAETVRGNVGTARTDVIIGTAQLDRIRGLGGNDLICALGGNDRVNGGPGSDRVDLGPGNDEREASPGNDVIYGRAGNDRLFGGPGNDLLYGGPGNDLLNGGSGMDRGFGQIGEDECLLIEVVATCEDETEEGKPVTITILRVTHYHPPGAQSSFSCLAIDGTDGASYIAVVRGAGVQSGSAQREGTLGTGPETVVFDIIAAGQLTFDVTAIRGGETASDIETYTVPTPGPPANAGEPSCRR